MSERKRAFVLSGGGARGALQVGALRALLEAGIYPDLLVGTSIGALNAAALAVYGVNLAGVEAMARAWHDAVEANLVPTLSWWQIVRGLLRRPDGTFTARLCDFFFSHGLDPDLRFGDIQGVQLIMVAADLNSGSVVLYGTDPTHLVLEGLLASTALIPWIPAVEKGGRYVVDGGVVSNLPVEPALACGATEIVALDLADERVLTSSRGLMALMTKLAVTMGRRQATLEMALAAERGVPVYHIPLRHEVPVPIWDFGHTAALMARGYDVTRQVVAEWQRERLVSATEKRGWGHAARQRLRQWLTSFTGRRDLAPDRSPPGLSDTGPVGRGVAAPVSTQLGHDSP